MGDEADRLTGVAEKLLANPFEDRPASEAARRELDDALPRASGLLGELIAAGQAGRARRLALALALCDLRRPRPIGLVERGGLAERLFDDMKLSRAVVARTAAAGARCMVALEALAGSSPAIRRTRAAAWRACFGDDLYGSIRLQPLLREQHVLILAETGCGKELVARAIGAAAAGPCEAINAAALPRDLVEGELFGHTRGAFTGAAGDREGKIASASGGTLFIDEIADLALPVQPKLLRVIETGEVTPLGSNQSRKVDVRYLGATAQPLLAMVERGEFRGDLYQRLARLTIEIPPLRERPEDVEPIAHAIFRRFADRLGQSAEAAAASTSHLSKLTVLEARFHAWLAQSGASAHHWPGNVRELENLVRAWVLGAGEVAVGPATPPAAAPEGSGPSLPAPEVARILDGKATLREVEDWYTLHVLARTGYSQRAAARLLGVDRGTLARRLKRIEDGSE